MRKKDDYKICDMISFCVRVLLFFIIAHPARAINVEELASVCEALESAIYDMHVEYEWRVDPPTAFEEIEGTGEIIKKPRSKCQWATARPFAARSLAVESAEYINGRGVSWHGVTKNSYNGRVGKYLQIIDKSKSGPRNLDGAITKDRRYVTHSNVTPQGFTILRFHELPLSKRMRGEEEVVIDENIQEINGFNTIRADFVHPASSPKKGPYFSIYFSTDHDYTPVRFEYKSFSGFVDVTELEKVAEGLWFPKSGRIHKSESENYNTYTATKIAVNQGLKDEYFNIEFPPGTKVRDEILGLEYTIQPTEEQLNQWLPKQGALETEHQRPVRITTKASASDSNVETVPTEIPDDITQQHPLSKEHLMQDKQSPLRVLCYIIAVVFIVASALVLRKLLIKEKSGAQK